MTGYRRGNKLKEAGNIFRMENKDKMWGPTLWLMLLALIALAFYAMHIGKTLEGVGLIVGFLGAKAGTMIDYKYGSSAGSKEKTELMAKRDAQTNV